MSRTVNMYIVVPVQLATALKERRKVKDHNTLPQIDPLALATVREFMKENVGFPDLPMACLSLNQKAQSMACNELFHVLPANNQATVLFQLQVPEDMIVSIEYKKLLEISERFKEAAGDEFEIELAQEDLTSILTLGNDGGAESEELICFIPFLSYDHCKFYAKFNKEFEVDELDLPGLEKFSLAKLSAFIN